MANRIFKILATSLVLAATTVLCTELATARGGGGGHFGGGGGAHFSGGAGHFGGGAAHFGGGAVRFGGGAARFGGGQFRSFTGGPARLGGSHFRSFNAARFSGSRSFSHFNRLNARNLSSGRLGAPRVALMHGAHVSGLSGSHVAWNHWGNHAWRAGWNGGWGGWHGGWGFWGGSVFWPYFYGDLFAFAFWPWGYYDPFWAYGDVFIWDAMFWPGPAYAYGPGPYDVYAYGGPTRQRVRRSRNDDRDITGFTNIGDLAQNCGGLAPGVTDLPIDSIERAVQPTDEQHAALAALKAASLQASDALKASCSSETMLTPLGRLDTVQKRLDGMIQALGIMRTPLDNFYNSLSAEQKQRFAELGSDVRKSRRGSTSGSDLAELCTNRTESFAQPPVDRIEQAVRPTPEQRDAFASLQIASTEAANQLRESCPSQTPRFPLDRFDALAKRLDAMAAAIKTVRPALARFYDSLTDEQKARFNMLGPPQQASRQGGTRLR